MSDTPPSIDYMALSYPSDRLTIQAIREAHPNGFEQEQPEFFNAERWADRRNLNMLFTMERMLAHKAFSARLGLPDPYPSEPTPEFGWTRRQILKSLAEDYKNYGLSTGRQHTEQLARNIEAQAVAQADQHLGKGL